MTADPARRPGALARRLRVVAGIAGAGIGVGVAAGLLAALGYALGAAPLGAVVPVAIAAGAGASAAFAALAAARRDLRAIRHALDLEAAAGRARGRSLDVVRRDVASLRHETPVIAALAPLADGYPIPFGGPYPMTADSLGALVRLVAERRPRVIVELGSGLSTLLLALTVRRLGQGRVVSIDHDPGWADETRRRLAAMGLEGAATVIVAPLRGQEFAGERHDWYDIPAGALPEQEIDLLVVDGPPARIDPTGLARWPALPALGSRLAADAVVFVDDAVRDGEKAMVGRWTTDQPGWRVTELPTQRGTFVLVRASGEV